MNVGTNGHTVAALSMAITPTSFRFSFIANAAQTYTFGQVWIATQ